MQDIAGVPLSRHRKKKSNRVQYQFLLVPISMVAMGGGSPAVLLLLLAASVLSPGAMSARFMFTSNCRDVIYPGVLTGSGRPPFPTTGFELQPGATADYAGVPDNWSGNVWARRLCSTDSAGRFSCESGDCGTGAVECNGSGNGPPSTLSEFTLRGGTGGATDYYDISNVDGFNVPVQVAPFDVPGGVPGAGCGTAACAADIDASCPPELAARDAAGVAVVGCKSGCLAFDRDDLCCRGAYATPDRCGPSDYSRFFKQQCPQAYSYAYDDQSSTFTCSSGASYHITFCP
ncbi:thaumatin-like protein 1 [Oryza brachyantha]|uniref:thaumatin-like protein 1 n=1 Tax=Oryza brachyantha TaxID=4533 RepID=UPI001AD9D327|nr:thaumatin-like protein 1 [Oryza brachyantha]